MKAQEKAVRSFISSLEGSQPDEDNVLGHLAPGATYHEIAWREPLDAHQAMRAGIKRQGSVFIDLKIEVDKVLVQGQTVMVERVDRFVMNGTAKAFHVVGVYTLDADNKILSWRDYLDSKEAESQQVPMAETYDPELTAPR